LDWLELTQFQIARSSIAKKSFLQAHVCWLRIDALCVEAQRLAEALPFKIVISLLLEVLGNFWWSQMLSELIALKTACGRRTIRSPFMSQVLQGGKHGVV
jgi:hypothetical protein